MPTTRKRKSVLILGLLLLTCVALYFLFPRTYKSATTWDGTWSFYYFYENDSSLIYTGQLEIETHDSLTLQLQVKPPKSSRHKILSTKVVSYSKQSIEGEIVHQHYKINGGHPKETFAWSLTENTFVGSGQCHAYCAEGTEGLTINWYGERNEENL